VRDDGLWKEVLNMKAVPRKKLMRKVGLIDGLMHNVVKEDMSLTELNSFLYAGEILVALRLGLKIESDKKVEQKKPHWQRRIERSIKVWWKDLS